MGARKIWPRWKVTGTGCHEWLLKKHKGYGVEYSARYRKHVKAHRAAWERERGAIPDGMEIHHKCGNRGCVNVEHLELVTNKGHRGKHRCGKLTKAKVIEIRKLRARGMPYGEIAAKFGINAAHCIDIAQGKYWKEVGGPIASVTKPKLNAEKVRQMRNLRSMGVPVKEVAARFRVHPIYVCQICSKNPRYWKDY